MFWVKIKTVEIENGDKPVLLFWTRAKLVPLLLFPDYLDRRHRHSLMEIYEYIYQTVDIKQSYVYTIVRGH